MAAIKNEKEYAKELEKTTQRLYEKAESTSLTRKEIADYVDTMVQLQRAEQNAEELLKKYQLSAGETSVAIEAMTQAQNEGKTNTEALIAALDAVIAKRQEDSNVIDEETQALINQRNAIANFGTKGITGIDPSNFVQTAQAISQVTFGVSAISSAIKSLSDEDLSP